MFDETLVVQSAVSAFNNAALAAPTFFWLALLATPLLAIAYFYGADFVRRIGWRDADLVKNSSIMTIAITLVWLISFGGNYTALRDASSVLPYCVAAVVFGACVCLGAASHGVKLPRLRGVTRGARLWILASALLITFFVGMSGVHTWWGCGLQILAFWGGLALGRKLRRAPTDVPASTLIIGVIATLVLMQPEFFRFGELGVLTVVHMGALMFLMMTVAAIFAMRNVNPRGRIHHSAYVKLKWMLRFVVTLGGALFLLTESVPVFLGTAVVLFAMFAMSVWHAKMAPKNLDMYMWALTLISFGVVVTLPVISAIGVLVWVSMPKMQVWKESKFLL